MIQIEPAPQSADLIARFPTLASAVDLQFLQAKEGAHIRGAVAFAERQGQLHLLDLWAQEPEIADGLVRAALFRGLRKGIAYFILPLLETQNPPSPLHRWLAETGLADTGQSIAIETVFSHKSCG